MNREEVNARIGTTDIKGKAYAQVNQRILAFWELIPNGRIVTEKLADDGERCDFKASIYVGDDLVATGHAFEVKGASYINKTSYIENCETSAVGRALGMFGIGITESLASAEEVQNAQEQQQSANKAAKRDTRPQSAELAKAQKRLADAEKAFCKKNADSLHEKGIATVGDFHREITMQRADYSETAEALNRIADEFEECV